MMRAGLRKHWCRACCQTFKGYYSSPRRAGGPTRHHTCRALPRTPPPHPPRPTAHAAARATLSRSRSPPLVSTLVVAAPAPAAPRPLARAALARVVVGERPQRDSRPALGARRQRVRRLEGGDAEEARESTRTACARGTRGGGGGERAARGTSGGGAAGREAGAPRGWPRPFRRSATAPGRTARARRASTCSSARGAASTTAVSSCGARGTSRPPRSPTGGI